MKAILQAVVRDGRSLRLAVVLAFASLWFASAYSLARAQQPDGDFEGERNFKQPDGKVVQLTDPKLSKSKIPGILRNGKTATAEEEKHFTDFFRYRLAEMTWKENITSLPTKRKELKNYLGQAGRGAAPDLHVRLNKWILEDCEKVAKDARYPRAIRLNCVLMIGELDQREARVGGPGAIPLPEAEPVLFGIFKDESQHDALRIEALIGLKRHAEANLTADQRAELVGAMTKLLKSKEPAKGKSPVGHQWMRMLACDMISTLADKGAEANQPEVVDAFQTLISEKSSDLWLRCYAAGEMGYLQSKAFPQEKVMPLAQQMADLVVEVAQTNDRLMANAGLNAQKAKAPAKPAPAKLDADKKDDKKAKKDGDDKEEEEGPPAPAIPESVLKAAASDVAGQLIRIRYGLNGAEISDRNAQPSTDHALYAAGDQAGKAFIKDVVARIDNMLKLLRDKKELYEQLANISTEGGDMQNWLKQQGAGAEQKPEQQPDKVVAPGAKPPAASSTKRPSGSKGAAESAVGQE